MKTFVSFIIFVMVVVGLLYAISGQRSPQIPNDETHKGITEPVVCLNCHGPEKEYARKPAHPPKDECLKCHRVKRKKK
ncbi:MAG: hypothetical protein Q8J64_10585 [Thermodesulfovibrionales bacterium]|nr:hypothetical protein [Thermodesulfovibrionales bacterium]